MKFQDALIDNISLQKTNATWNKCQVNHPWSIGYTSHLIARQPFTTLDNWVTYYFDSGDKRDILIDLLQEKEARLLLRTPDVPKILGKKHKSLEPTLKKLNLEYGRSWESIENRIRFFQKALKATSINFKHKVCTKIFLQRVIVDTWNGRVREKNTITYLQCKFPELEYQESDAWSDFNYGIDFNVLEDGILIAAIQVKPLSYRGKKKYISAARKANKKKWMLFEKEKGASVFLILSNEKGEIQEENGLIDFLKNKRC
ncbi:MAG: hypothetical protein ACJA01_001284 [Saprospiraceae bacterium]|jgi:hypothetical protein